MTDNKVKLNDDKTEVMIISHSRMFTPLSIPDSSATGDTSVPFSDTIRHLGVTLDCHLYFKPYAVYQSEQLSVNFFTSVPFVIS